MKQLRYITMLLLFVLLASVVHDVDAQINAQTDDELPWIVVLGITEGPDPIPQIVYLRVDDIDTNLILIALMAGRDDRRPDVSFKEGRELVTWSYKTRNQDYDIALAQWNGLYWDPTKILPFVGKDELDPRAFTTPDGVTHLVWWEDGDTQTVFLDFGENLSREVPELVTEFGESGRRPTVVVWQGSQLVAYERDSAAGGQEIVLASRQPNQSFSREILQTLNRTEPLDVKLHAEQGELWIDWIFSDSEFAYSRFVDGEWTDPEITPWTDTSWLGIQETRELIRQEILNP